MNLIKKSFLSLLVLLVFTVIVLWVLTKTIQPEYVKDIITTKLQALTSQQSQINGDISWQLFPRPGITINNIQIGEDHKDVSYSLAVDELQLNLQLKSLIRGKLVFNELNVDGFKLTIYPEAKRLNTLNNSSIPALPTEKKIKVKSSAKFVIDSMLLSHGEVNMMGQKETLSLTGLQVGATQFNFQNNFFPIQLKSDVLTTGPQNISANLNFKGRTRVNTLLFKNLISELQHAVLEGQLLIEDLQINQLKVEKINANVITEADALILNPLNISLYDGESVGDLRYQYASQTVAINQTATGVDASPLFNALLNQHVLKGSLDFSIHGTTTFLGNNWKNNFRGNGSVTVKDGVLYFVDLNKLIDGITQKTHALLQQEFSNKSAPLLNNPMAYDKGKTKFQLMSIQYRVQQENLIDDTLLLQTKEFQLKGLGQINLNNNTIDSELSAKLLNPDNVMDEIQQYLDGSLPFKLYGQLTNPQILPDIQKVTPLITHYLLKKTLAKPTKQLKTTLKKLLDELS